jgi:hypothetical protein
MAVHKFPQLSLKIPLLSLKFSVGHEEFPPKGWAFIINECEFFFARSIGVEGHLPGNWRKFGP